MRTWTIVLILATTCAAAPAQAEKTYSMKDLEALVKSESWSELSQHLEDVAPSERTPKWQKIVETTALKLLAEEKQDGNPFWALVLADGFTKRFGFLKKSRAFMDKRAAAGIKGFEACYKMSYSGGPCNERILPFVEADSGNVQFALQAGQLVIRNQHHYFAMPFFRHAVVWAKGDKKTCTASRLGEALEATLALPTSYAKLVAAAQDTARTCWATLRGTLLEKLLVGNSYWVTNLCPLVKEKREKSRRCK